MRKLCGLLCATTLAAFVPMCAAADAPPATEAAPAVTAPPAATESPAAAAPKSDKEKLSYAIGVSWGMQLKGANLDLDLESLSQGLRDAAAGHKLALTDPEIQAAIDKMKTEMAQKREERIKALTAQMKEMGEKNKVEGPKFLEANKKKKGVVTLPDGLEYEVTSKGEGKLPGPSDVVTISYRGTFIDGKEFDSSTVHGKPLEVGLDGTFIPGMIEALKLMKAGAKWTIFIPPELAYKDQGMFPIIGPNAVLIFEVEVLGIKERPKEAPAMPMQ